MRTVTIDKLKVMCFEKGVPITCPLSNYPELSDGCCYTNCAWFRISSWLDAGREMVRLDTKNFAYCGDKLIGEIVEQEK